jgi:excinuclease ABC subunit B
VPESLFKLRSTFTPTGDQPKAIEQLTRGLDRGEQYQVLVGITGSGKTFSIANVIQHAGAPV